MAMIILDADEIASLSSDYIREGRRQDQWRISHLAIEGKQFSAIIDMNSFGVSKQDINGFHLSIFTALEFISQLNVIYLHHWAGFSEKTLECWMIEINITSHHVIRSHENIKVNTQVDSIRRLRGKIYIRSTSKVMDETGEFIVQIKAIANGEGISESGQYT